MNLCQECGRDADDGHFHLDTAMFEPDWKEVVIKPKRKCDCGGDSCKTTHAHWCSTNDRRN